MKKTIDVIPAVLARFEAELKENIDKVAPLNDEIHIDYADGKFVTQVSVDFQYILDLPEQYHNNLFELHLMAKEPLALAQLAAEVGFTKIIVHIEELKAGDETIIKDLSDYVDIAVAINPQTLVEKLKDYLPFVQGVTIMTVEPGAQGNDFVIDALKKVAEIRAMHFTEAIEIDGGINLTTITNVKLLPIDRVIIGSALIKADDPKKIYTKLVDKINS